MGYFDRTEEILKENGGHAPNCTNCGHEMVTEDDHGRFKCFHCPSVDSLLPGIPQVSTAGLTNEQIAQIPPFNRLHSAGTTAEQELMRIMLRGPDYMDDPAYFEAQKKLEEERKLKK